MTRQSKSTTMQTKRSKLATVRRILTKRERLAVIDDSAEEVRRLDDMLWHIKQGALQDSGGSDTYAVEARKILFEIADRAPLMTPSWAMQTQSP